MVAGGLALALDDGLGGPTDPHQTLFAEDVLIAPAVPGESGGDSDLLESLLGTVPIFPQRKWDCPPPKPSSTVESNGSLPDDPVLAEQARAAADRLWASFAGLPDPRAWGIGSEPLPAASPVPVRSGTSGLSSPVGVSEPGGSAAPATSTESARSSAPAANPLNSGPHSHVEPPEQGWTMYMEGEEGGGEDPPPDDPPPEDPPPDDPPPEDPPPDDPPPDDPPPDDPPPDDPPPEDPPPEDPPPEDPPPEDPPPDDPPPEDPPPEDPPPDDPPPEDPPPEDPPPEDPPPEDPPPEDPPPDDPPPDDPPLEDPPPDDPPPDDPPPDDPPPEDPPPEDPPPDDPPPDDPPMPCAYEDYYDTMHDESLLVDSYYGGVLANDHDVDSAVLVDGPSYATDFTFNSNGTFYYEPQPNWAGGDSFTYRGISGLEDTGEIVAWIGVMNEAPEMVVGNRSRVFRAFGTFPR